MSIKPFQKTDKLIEAKNPEPKYMLRATTAA